MLRIYSHIGFIQHLGFINFIIEPSRLLELSPYLEGHAYEI